MAAWQGFVIRYLLFAMKPRIVSLLFKNELVCDVRDSQTQRRCRARTRTEISSAPTATHARRTPRRSREGREAPPRARHTDGRTRRARRARPGAGQHPEMRDANGEIYLFIYAHVGYVTPPPPRPRPRTAIHLGVGAHRPLHTLPLRAHTRRARLRTCSHSNAQRFKPKQLQVCARLSTSLDGSSGPARHGRAACACTRGRRRWLATPTHCGL